jgi:hypothetical protein
MLCVRVHAPQEGCARRLVEGGVLQLVSEPTIVVVRTGQCAGIGRMACVARVGHTAWSMAPALDERACAKGERSWTFACVGELRRRGRRVL